MSAENNEIGCPPPGGGGGGLRTAGALAGMVLEIATDSAVEISHTFLQGGSPDADCLIVIQVKFKGQMKAAWANPNYGNESGDHRASQFSAKLGNDKIIIISAKSIGFETSAGGAVLPQDFWNDFGMTPVQHSSFDWFTEYWGRSTGRKDAYKINLKDGLIKQVDMSWPAEQTAQTQMMATKTRKDPRSRKKTSTKKRQKKNQKINKKKAGY